jgi:hypothetical protein
MSNPVVLVTGALTGIGRATAIAFAERGARVAVSGRRPVPKEISDAIIFITSDKAAFMTGEIVTIDGGLAAGRPAWGATLWAPTRSRSLPPVHGLVRLAMVTTSGKYATVCRLNGIRPPLVALTTSRQVADTEDCSNSL